MPWCSVSHRGGVTRRGRINIGRESDVGDCAAVRQITCVVLTKCYHFRLVAPGAHIEARICELYRHRARNPTMSAADTCAPILTENTRMALRGNPANVAALNYGAGIFRINRHTSIAWHWLLSMLRLTWQAISDRCAAAGDGSGGTKSKSSFQSSSIVAERRAWAFGEALRRWAYKRRRRARHSPI